LNSLCTQPWPPRPEPRDEPQAWVHSAEFGPEQLQADPLPADLPRPRVMGYRL